MWRGTQDIQHGTTLFRIRTWDSNTPPDHVLHSSRHYKVGVVVYSTITTNAGLGSIRIRSIQVSKRPRKNGENGENGENGGKWGKMGGNRGKTGKNEGKWRKMGGNGKLLQIHHGKCMKLFQQERKMEENGVEMGGKWVKNGTWAGPIFPIFPKGNLLPHRAVNKKPSIQVSGWENGENGGIRR